MQLDLRTRRLFCYPALVVALLRAVNGDNITVLNCSCSGIISPFGVEFDFRACGSVYGKGEFRSVVHKNLLCVVSFISDPNNAIACCASRSGGFQCNNG